MFSQRGIAEVEDSSSLLQDCLFSNRFSGAVTPDSHTPPVDESEPFRAVQGSSKKSYGSNRVGDAFVYGRESSSISGMGNSSLVEAVNDEVMSGCKSLLFSDMNEDNEFIDGDEVRCIRRINGRFYNEAERDSCEKMRHSVSKELEGSLLDTTHTQNSNDSIPDPRTISPTELATVIHKNQNLSLTEKGSLITLIMKYRHSLTSKPGKCTLMEYEFKLTDENPVMDYTRVIPFVVRPVTAFCLTRLYISIRERLTVFGILCLGL
jgi:hypothetical protein